MFVLGIDPGLSRCGYGVVTRRGGDRLTAVAGGVISTPPSAPLPERLHILAEELRALVREHRPEAVVVERVFFQVNARTAMATGQAAGVALVAAAESGCEVAQYTSNEVKQAIVGYGNATKAQVQRMVAAVLGLSEPPSSPDVADALALAACHLTTRPLWRAVNAAVGDSATGGSADDSPSVTSGTRSEHALGPRPRVARRRGRRGREPGMIGYLRGALLERPEPDEVVVDVQGVGYRVSVPTSVAAAVGAPGSEVRLHVHTHVREDAIVLYGFAHADERRCFEALLGAHGVGPTLALSILSSLSPAALSTAVLEDDAATLCDVPGVGRKTAARLLLELKARLDLPSLDGSGAGPTGGSARGEAREALAELGYGPDEIRGALEAVEDQASVEELVRSALRELARSR